MTAGLLIASLLLAALPAVAQTASTPMQVGAWRVSTPGTGFRCNAATAYGEHFLIALDQDAAGAVTVVLRDDRWLLKDMDRKPATISWDGWTTSGPIDFTVVSLGAGTWGLVTETDSSFLEKLGSARRVALRIPGVELDHEFTVADGPAVAAAMARCRANLRTP